MAVGAFVERVHKYLNANKGDIMHVKSMFVCETFGKQIPDSTPFNFEHPAFGMG
jgi:hypothetical protein